MVLQTILPLLATAVISATVPPPEASDGGLASISFCRLAPSNRQLLSCPVSVARKAANGQVSQNTAPTSPPPPPPPKLAWELTESRSSVGDSKQVTATLAAVYGKGTLILRCTEKKMEALYAFGHSIKFIGKSLSVVYRIDADPDVTAKWSEASAPQTLSIPAEVISSLHDDAFLIIRLADFTPDFDSRFDVTNITAIRENIASTCN